MRLAELQTLFFRFVTNVDGARAASEATGVDPASFVVGDDQLSAEARMDIFADDYGSRILNTLREFYERVERYVGEVGFVDLVFDYLQASPPTSYSLRDLGEHLPELCRTHRMAETHPALADLARLEWLMHTLYDQEDEALLVQADLRDVPAHEWGTLRLVLIASHVVFDAQYDVVDDLAAKATRVLVWRQDHGVHCRALDHDESTALTRLSAGDTFGEICEALATSVAAAEVPGLMLGFLNRWIADGLLSGDSHVRAKASHGAGPERVAADQLPSRIITARE